MSVAGRVDDIMLKKYLFDQCIRQDQQRESSKSSINMPIYNAFLHNSSGILMLLGPAAEVSVIEIYLETNQHIELIAKMGMETNKRIMFHVQGVSHVKDIVSALLLSSMFRKHYVF